METGIATIAPAVSTQAQSCALEAKLLTEAPGEWAQVLAGCANVPVAYTPEMVRYQSAYMTDAGCEHSDCSLVLFNDRKPVAVWPLSTHRQDGVWRFGSQESSVRPPLFADWVGDNTRKTLNERCLLLLETLAQPLEIATWRGTLSPRGGSLDSWYRRVMERGATTSVGHELWIDLSRPLEDIRLNIRKSFRPLISKGLKLWKTSLAYGQLEPGAFEAFRQFHIAVAGRETRSKLTWDLQEKMILDRQAFLVQLHDQTDRLVAGGLFHLSATEAFYGVGVYDRDLFDLPLGHVVQMKAIEQMKELGLKWYYVGSRPYPADSNAPSPKELSISHFKEGFATHMFASFQTVCPLQKHS